MLWEEKEFLKVHYMFEFRKRICVLTDYMQDFQVHVTLDIKQKASLNSDKESDLD